MRHDHATTTTPASPLAGERYLSLTTFTRVGTPKSVPVWPVDAGDGRIGFVTSSMTWKVKRIRADSRVTVQPSDAKGRVRQNSTPISGVAEVADGAAFDSMRRKVKAKYGFQLAVIDALHALPGRRTGHRNDCAVVITFDRS